MLKTINSTKLRSHFKDSLDHIKTSKNPLIITERDVPTAVLIDIDEFEDLLSSKNKDFIASIKKAREQYKKGNVFDMNDVFADVI